MQYVALLLIGIRLAFAGSHSLQYLYTGVSGVLRIPEFTVVGLVDDQQFLYCDSNTKKAVPKTEWIRLNEGEDYWKRQSATFIDYFQDYKNYMQSIMDLYSQSKGVHTLQVMYGCELKDTDNTQGYYRFGYDGEDFISFDVKTLSWTAANPQAVEIKKQWDANQVNSQIWKKYLENECIELLKKYLGYCRDSRQRKVPPEVSLWQKDPLFPTVICHATGFYPSDIIMNWRNENKDLKTVKVSLTLPNEDGSFQKSSSLLLKPEKWKNSPDVYRCVVQHVGEGEQIVVLLNENNIKSNTASDYSIVIGFVLAAAVVYAIIVFIVWRKCNQYEESATEPSIELPAPLLTRNVQEIDEKFESDPGRSEHTM